MHLIPAPGRKEFEVLGWGDLGRNLNDCSRAARAWDVPQGLYVDNMQKIQISAYKPQICVLTLGLWARAPCTEKEVVWGSPKSILSGKYLGVHPTHHVQKALPYHRIRMN